MTSAEPSVRDYSDRFCIVGAGPSGLCMAAEFKARNVPYDHFERYGSVGGIWEIEHPETPVYESAHFISSKTQSAFSGFPMPDSYPDYPRHDQILAYLKAYAQHHQLVENISFHTTVESVVPQKGSALVSVGGELRRYRGAVCASGVNWEPFMPEIPGEFAGEIRHSKLYRRASEFAGKRVLIVGLGNSGADIACDAARSAQAAWVSVRRGYHFVPKHIFGIPSDVFAHEGPQLPLWLERPVFGFLLRLIVGDIQKLGMPKPDHALLDSHPLLNDQLLHHLRHGDINLKPDIESVNQRQIRFVDGTMVEVDLILCATGYRRNIPYLADEYVQGSWAAAHFLTCFHPGFDSLFTLGFVEQNGALYPQLSRMAQLIGYVAQAELSDPKRAVSFYEWANETSFDLSGAGSSFRAFATSTTVTRLP